jgi:hypothetical protein
MGYLLQRLVNCSTLLLNRKHVFVMLTSFGLKISGSFSFVNFPDSTCQENPGRSTSKFVCVPHLKVAHSQRNQKGPLPVPEQK